MKRFLVCLFFFCSFKLLGVESYPTGTVRSICKKQGLSSYVRLLVVSYFQDKIPPLLLPDTENTYLLKKDHQKITKCRKSIALQTNVNSWLDLVDFGSLSPTFQDVLQEQVGRLRTYTRPPNNEKLSIIVSRRFSWTEGIALIRRVYGEGDGRYVSVKTFEDSLFLIFMRILLPNFLDYPLSFMSEKSRAKKLMDERFFANCMESAIANYMEKVEKYDGPDPLSECEKRYCSGFGSINSNYKEKMD